VTRAVREILDANNPVHVDRGPTKGGVITKITRNLLRGLQRRPLDRLEEFGPALADFTESWFKAHPSPDEPAPTNDGGRS
jgi:hypothetical protein